MKKETQLCTGTRKKNENDVFNGICKSEVDFLLSVVISYGELSLPSPHGEVLMYIWKWMLSLNLKPRSLCCTNIDSSQSSGLLLQWQERETTSKRETDEDGNSIHLSTRNRFSRLFSSDGASWRQREMDSESVIPQSIFCCHIDSWT